MRNGTIDTFYSRMISLKSSSYGMIMGEISEENLDKLKSEKKKIRSTLAKFEKAKSEVRKAVSSEEISEEKRKN